MSKHQTPRVRATLYLPRDVLEEARDAAVHLVGIIKESANSRFVDAHEATTRTLEAAAARAGVSRIVYMSILGSHPEAANACLASKGRAEQILLEGRISTVVLRVPMVLGEGDYASAALARKAVRSLVFELGASSLELG